MMVPLCGQQLYAGYRFLPFLERSAWQPTGLKKHLDATRFALINSNGTGALTSTVFWIFVKSRTYSMQKEAQHFLRCMTLGPLHELQNYRDDRLIKENECWFGRTDEFITLIADRFKREPSELQIVVDPSIRCVSTYLLTRDYTVISTASEQMPSALENSNIILHRYFTDHSYLEGLKSSSERWQWSSKVNNLDDYSRYPDGRFTYPDCRASYWPSRNPENSFFDTLQCRIKERRAVLAVDTGAKERQRALEERQTREQTKRDRMHKLIGASVEPELENPWL